MRIKFLGAAQNVTGSRFLLESGRSRILVDCGLYQERQFLDRNWNDFPVPPASISQILLTHAHLDHCGFLPRLVKLGFQGNIFCTEPTAEICRIVLLDAAKLQEEDAYFKQKRHRREGRQAPHPEEPLYTVEDAEKVFPLFRTVSYQQPVPVAPGVTAVFHDAGHILGAAMIEVEVQEDGRKKTAVFSGDIGRLRRPILNDPTVFTKADYVFMESTYGNRLHETSEDSLEKLQSAILETTLSRGNIIVPTFAIERAQEILYYLNQLLKKDAVPQIPVFFDSPMAIAVTEVYKKFVEYLDPETQGLINSGDSPFDFPGLRLIRSGEESKTLNSFRHTAFIIAGSGMCTGGRIKHHLAQNISRPESTVLFVGYQAEGTLGRQILERPKSVRILGQVYPVRAGIRKINGFSGHADQAELLKWVSAFKKPPAKIFLIHGEGNTMSDFAGALKQRTGGEIIIPQYLQEAEL